MLAEWLNRRQPEWLERVRLGAPCRLGPTGELALAIGGRWKARSIFVQLITKLDEARTHEASDFMMMAGYMARVGQWNRFDHKWRKALRKAQLEYFHAQEMPHHPFGVKGAYISEDNLMCGFVVRLNRRDFEEVYRAGPWGRKAQPDSMYGLCFRYCLSAALDVGLAEYPNDLRLDFIVESGHPNEGAPNEIVRRLKNMKIKGASEFLGTVTPMEKKECYGLQAADGLATGAGWIEAGEIAVPPNFLSTPAAPSSLFKTTTRKAPNFMCHISRDEIASFRDDFFVFVERRRQFGQQRNAEIEARKRASFFFRTDFARGFSGGRF